MKILFTLPCLLFGIFVHPILLYAGTNITLPFSSTFNCPESVQTSWGSYDDIAGCPGWQGDGGSPTSNGSYDRISSADNNSSGGGGRGWGHAVGDGQNNNGGSIRITFAPQTNLWVRFYMRYPSGFSWSGGQPGYQKILYINPPGHVAEFTGTLIGYYNETLSTHSASNAGWSTIMGGSTGDGQWHAYEWHIKIGNPGIMETWVDGALVHSNTSINTGSTPISVLNILTNQNQPTNGGDRYISIDDFAISNTGYIGLIGGGSDTSPTWPTGTTFSASATSSSSITVTWSAATDDHGVSSYQVQRCTGLPAACPDASFSQVGTPTTSPFVNNTGLSANTDYSYRVRAVDTIGQLSGWTNTVSARTQAGTPAPTFTFSASPASITSGTSSTLTWSAVTNATSCTASGGTFTGSKSTSGGTQSVSPTSTTTYTLSCTGAGGTTNQTATVTVSGGTGTTFFSEGYENTSFASRGWYDNTGGAISTAEHHSGTGSLQCTYNSGGLGCAAGGPGRHKFPESNSVYASYWVKYSTNFVGSGVGYHPHEIYFLTNQNGDYDGLAFDYLTMYLESHWGSSSNGYMQAGFQDGQNIDQSRRGQNLIGVTENRGVAGCNGSPSGYSGDCYDRGDGVYVNGTVLGTPQTFTTANKNTWNHVEAFYQLNSISNGIGQADGILRIWFNDALVFERTNAILRTGAQPNMRFNQFIFGPWIGDGSPVTQTMWLDDLEVRDTRPSTGDTQSPTSPSGLAANATSTSSITVSWNPSTDNVGVTGYIVERCQGTGCSNFAQVGTLTVSPFVDSGLTMGTFYNYHVRARDAAGNLSGWSNVVGATTQSTAQVACNTVTPANFSQSAYNSYGAPYDLFAANAQLVDAKCTSADTHTINATIGKTGDTTRIVYTKGYYFDPGINNWAPYTSTCTGTLNGDWCAGPTTATITDADLSTASAGTPVYFVGMVCSVQNGSWRCGCRDTSCTNFYWMIQGAGQ